jgi:glyoxylase-like metal-dependent hydrolase (beta-lactamase superfamily II)
MGHFDRRRFLELNAAALAGAALTPATALGTSPSPAAAASPPGRDASPGFYRFSAEDAEVTVLSDGHFHFPMELVGIDVDPLEFQAASVDPETREEYFRSRMVPSDHIPLQTSPVLIDSGERRTLVDAGVGEAEQTPTAGRLARSLEAAGASPESVDTVVLTHAHPDHLGGLLDPATGAPLCPDAELVVSDVELDYWRSDAADANPLAPPAREVLGALDDRIRTVGMDDEVATGIRSVPSPGHTPGHVSIAVEAGDESLLLAGDAIVFTHASFERPEWELMIDLDPEVAGQTRRRLLDRAVADEMLLVGYHFPFPGLGYALEDGDAFRFHPAGWTVLS